MNNKLSSSAEKAATVIWDHNFGAWCGLNAGQMTPIIQAAIDEATKPLVEVLRCIPIEIMTILGPPYRIKFSEDTFQQLQIALAPYKKE